MLVNENEPDGRANDRVLNRFISLASGVRAPDAQRVTLRNKAFFGVSMGVSPTLPHSAQLR